MAADADRIAGRKALKELSEAQEEILDELRQGFVDHEDYNDWLRKVATSASLGYIRRQPLAFLRNLGVRGLMVGKDDSSRKFRVLLVEPWLIDEFRWATQEILKRATEDTRPQIRAKEATEEPW
jgi:hypothetical protein